MDLAVTNFIQSFRSPFLDKLMVLVSLPGYSPYKLLLLVLILVFVLLLKRYKEFLGLLIVSIGSEILEVVFKTLIARPRPDPNIIHYVYRVETSGSFPSGHVLFYTAFFGFIIFLTLKIKSKNIKSLLIAICGFFIILIGISRIYLGAHWFSDVIGGYFIGGLWLLCFVLLYNSWSENEKGKNKADI